MPKKKKEPKALTEQQQRFVDKTSNFAAWLLNLKPATLEKLEAHVLENGTDHDGGSAVDAFTQEIFRMTRDHQ